VQSVQDAKAQDIESVPNAGLDWPHGPDGADLGGIGQRAGRAGATEAISEALNTYGEYTSHVLPNASR
jgi:hypothetical protein